jgi:hypothetical protein
MRSNSRPALTVHAALFLTAACSGHRVAHVAPDESRPHITWEIRTGGRLGDDDVVCGSVAPSRPCLLPASTRDRPVLATVHVYLHAAAQQTSYLGVTRMPFLSGSEQLKDREISATVPRGSQPVSTTLSGNVTSEPGSYTLSISVDAIQPGTSTPHRIKQDVAVSVR